ncbi:MAG: hypothetical protein HY912_15755 [Desulfomonile tiedjei]|uniref:DUF4190 domain-containing protein n=1 Tax=Desulfomonile tiedjei TaxID=2358 RepID=A0A9D6V315_9BACT|nr:hypothetical protein [Desulfomonile tiedjei]
MNEDQTPVSPDSSLSPILADRPPPHQASPGLPVRESRADLVLILGILSLFMCGPLGLIAWIVANTDLKRIRAGTMSSRKIRLLKVGKALGIVGAILFAATILTITFVVQRNVSSLTEMFTPEPLKAHEFAFAGEWFGNRGTLIRIGFDGKGDFISGHSRVRGGAVSISDDRLSIGILGLSKSWHIDRRPYLEDGTWTIQLDGEVFRRRGDDSIVRMIREGLQDRSA